MSDVRILKDVCDRRANRIAYAECHAGCVGTRPVAEGRRGCAGFRIPETSDYSLSHPMGEGRGEGAHQGYRRRIARSSQPLIGSMLQCPGA
jgi:hypothetical protein